jgi:SAM-dependent methyltransferase
MTDVPTPVAGGFSPQWVAWRASVDLDEYERRFAHEQAHGEADLIESLARRPGPGGVRQAGSVLDAGCGTGRVAIELHARGIDVVGADLDIDLLELARAKAPAIRWVHADLAVMQLDRRFDMVAMPGNVMLFCRDDDRLAVVHSCAQHLLPGGLLVAGFSCDRSFSVDEYDRLCRSSELMPVHRWSTWDRTPFTDGDRYVVAVHERTLRARLDGA